MPTMDEKIGDVPADTEKGMDLSPKGTLGEGDVLILKHADLNDADEAMKAFEGIEADSIVMTLEMERKLLRKIDRNIMPVHLIHSFCFVSCVFLANRYIATLRRLRPQLSGQDDFVICFYHGPSERSPPRRR
jgi:hypothetical protein